MTESDREQCAGVVMEVIPPTMRFIRTEMRRHGASGLSVPQFRALAFLSRHNGPSLTDVADHLGVTRATASAMVERLVQQGMVDRQSDPQERRRHILTLTIAGTDLLQAARSATRAKIASALDHLTPAERATVAAGMALLSRAIKEAQAQAADSPPR